MTTTWPDGVVARYLTVAGVALSSPDVSVDVIDDGNKALCRGCGQSWGNPTYPFRVRPWAQAHAETCRAMPAPTN